MTDLRHSGATMTGRVVDSVTGAHIREVTVESGEILPLGKQEAFISDISIPVSAPRLVSVPQDLGAADIERRFTYHRAEGDKITEHDDIRVRFKAFATLLAANLPPGREKSLAFTALEESSFWAHAAIAREGK